MTRLLAALAPGVSSGEARGPGHRPDCRPVLGLLPGASFLIVRSPVCLWKMQATGQGREKEPRRPGLGGPSWGRSLSRWWLPAQDHGSPAQDPKGDRPHSLGVRRGKEVPWERQGSPRLQIRGLNAGSVRHPASCVPMHVACVCLGLRPCVGAERQAAPQPLVAPRGLSQGRPRSAAWCTGPQRPARPSSGASRTCLLQEEARASPSVARRWRVVPPCAPAPC